MNDQTRRFLDQDEEWNDRVQPTTGKRESKPAKKAVAQERRQREKEWGRAINKFHKEHARLRRQLDR
jgi:hypothetical protein